MSTPPRPEQSVSRVIYDEGQRLLRVTRDHAISEAWLSEYEPDLYGQWQQTTSASRRDEIAATMDRHFDAIESPTPAPAALGWTPSSLVAPSPCERLPELIDEYETRLIATGGARDSLPELRSHIQAHVGWNNLEQSPSTVAWRLRDWAEHAAPGLLTAWQRDVLAYGDITGGTERMATIAEAHRTSCSGTKRADAPNLRAVEPASAIPLRAVPGTCSERARARTDQTKITSIARGRPVLHGGPTSRTPHR